VTQGPDGTTETWEDVETRWAAVSLVSLEGRTRYQQIGHSEVQNEIRFRGPVDITLANHRFKWRDQYFEAIEPPGDPSTVGKGIIVAVREIDDV
jgi:head-tail adaptor